MEILQKIGYAVCHQLPERSIFIDNMQLPVCARCSGIYTGSLVSILFILFSSKRKSNVIPRMYIALIFLFFMFVMVADGLGSYTNLYRTTNDIRFITGFLCGMSFPFFLYPILIDNLFEKKSELPVLNNFYELLLLVFLSISFYFLILHFNHFLFYPISIFIVAGIISLHYLIFITLISFISYNLYSRKTITKLLTVFLCGIILLVVDFNILTKLHSLIKK